jgi:hypothetical protein
MAMTLYAWAAIECQDPRFAEVPLEMLAPWGDQFDFEGSMVQGPVNVHLGGLAAILGRYDEAEVYFAKSSAFCNRVDAKFFTSLTELWWGRMLAERRVSGDIERARELLSDARARAAENGYAAIERRANKTLNRLG